MNISKKDSQVYRNGGMVIADSNPKLADQPTMKARHALYSLHLKVNLTVTCKKMYRKSLIETFSPILLFYNKIINKNKLREPILLSNSYFKTYSSKYEITV